MLVSFLTRLTFHTVSVAIGFNLGCHSRIFSPWSSTRWRHKLSPAHMSPGRYRSSVLTWSDTCIAMSQETSQTVHKLRDGSTSEPVSGSDRVNLGCQSRIFSPWSSTRWRHRLSPAHMSPGRYRSSVLTWSAARLSESGSGFARSRSCG